MKFYTFSQNNSGGGFDRDDDVGDYVIVEAENEDDACARAEQIGIYFDGVSDGRDCECCGDRWSRPWETGSDAPQVYGEAPEKVLTGKYTLRETVVIHYADGRKTTLRKPTDC